MANNEKDNEDLTKSQAELVTRLLTELAERQSKINAEADKLSVERDRIEAERTKLAEEHSRVASAKDALLSDRQSLLDGQQQLIEDQRKLADGLAGLAAWESERASLLPQISALIDANRDANARESKRDAVLDSWCQSLARIEQNTGNVPALIEAIQGVISQGFEALSLSLANGQSLYEAIHESVQGIAARQIEDHASVNTRFNELDVAVNLVQTSTDRIGSMVNRIFDLVTHIRDMAKANLERVDAVYTEISSVKKHVQDVGMFFHKKVMAELSKFSEIPGKVEIQVRNLNNSIAKIKGETDAVVAKFSKYADTIALSTQAFEDQLLGMRELGTTLRSNLKRGVEIELGRLEESLSDFAAKAVKEYGEVLKKSGLYEIIGQIHGVSEGANLLIQGLGQATDDVRELVGDVDGTIKREAADLKEGLATTSKAMLGHFGEIQDTVLRTNSLTADSMARIQHEFGQMPAMVRDLNAKLLATAGSAETLMSLGSQGQIYIVKEFMKAFNDMCADLPDQVAKQVASIVESAEVSAMTKLLGGESPDEE